MRSGGSRPAPSLVGDEQQLVAALRLQQLLDSAQRLSDKAQELQRALLRELPRDSNFSRDDVVRGLAAPHFVWGRFHFLAAGGCVCGGNFGLDQCASVTRNGFCVGGKNILTGTLSIRFFFIAGFRPPSGWRIRFGDISSSLRNRSV
jgi:hypothetical protein